MINRPGTAWQHQLQQWVEAACVAEVSVCKPGNVHLGAAFADASIGDFLESAKTVAPILASTPQSGCGHAILKAARATRQAVGHNTNLGIILLLAPLAAVDQNVKLQDGIERVLAALTIVDAEQTYQAISLVQPAGLGEVQEQDLSAAPTQTLRACMGLAADRDLIAAQYVNGFQEVLHSGLDLLQQTLSWQTHSGDRLAWLATRLIASHGDSLIRRKCGDDMDATVRQLAQNVISLGYPFESAGRGAYDQFDAFLREDGHQRNPGTTADFVAAIVFAGLRDGICRANVTKIGVELSMSGEASSGGGN